jgi:hypothetical protein
MSYTHTTIQAVCQRTGIVIFTLSLVEIVQVRNGILSRILL